MVGNLEERARAACAAKAAQASAAQAEETRAAYAAMFGELEAPQDVAEDWVILDGLSLAYRPRHKAFVVVRQCRECGAIETGTTPVRNLETLGEALAEIDRQPHSCQYTWQEALALALQAGISQMKGA